MGWEFIIYLLAIAIVTAYPINPLKDKYFRGLTLLAGLICIFMLCRLVIIESKYKELTLPETRYELVQEPVYKRVEIKK